jgi:hypothetical protein
MKYDFGTSTGSTKYDFGNPTSEVNTPAPTPTKTVPTKLKFEAGNLKGLPSIEGGGAGTVGGIAYNTVVGLPKAGVKVAKDIGQALAKDFFGIGLSLGNAINKFRGKEIVTDYQPTNTVSKMILGDEPTHDIATRIVNNENAIKESPLAKKLGLDKQASKLAFGGVIGSIALDFTGGAGEKAVVKQLLKETAPEGVLKILSTLKIPPAVAEKFAPIFAESKTMKEVTDGLKLMHGTIGAENIAKTALKESAAKDFSSFHPEDQKYLSDFSSKVANKQPTTPEDLKLAKEIMNNYGYKTPESKTALADVISTAEQSVTNKAIDKTMQNTPQLNAISQLKQAIKTAEPLRGEIEVAQSVERAKRFSAAEAAQNAVGGQEGYYAGLSKLKGKLLEKPPSFTPPSQSMTPEAVKSLFNAVQSHPQLLFGEKLTGQSGLNKLLEGHVPVPSELSVLEDVFGTDVIKSIYDKRPLSKKIWDTVGEIIADVPRALKTTLDMSATLRQGIVMGINHPVRFTEAFGKSFRSMISNNYFEKALDTLKNTPEYLVAKDMGLHISDPRKLFGHREEFFLSNLAEKIPGIGRIVKASNRAYVGFSNSLRFNIFNDLAGSFAKDGVANKPTLKSLADFINTATGRGTLGSLERHASLLSKVMFAPRYMMSRIQFFNPVWYAKQPAPVRKEALKSFGSFVGTVTSVITLAKMGGADVEVDPRSSNFGKMKVNNTYYDLTAGFGQYIRTFAQLVSNSKKTQSGKLEKLGGKRPYDETRLDIAGRVIRGKLAPLPATIIDLAEGKNVVGEKVTPLSALKSNVMPLYVQDLSDALKDRGPEALFTVGLPSFFGVGVQTYQDKKSAPKYKF